MTMGILWQIALGCVFIEGVMFVLLTLTKLRQTLIEVIPSSIRYSIAAGIGMLIAFMGLIDAGVIVSHPSTFVTLGKMVSMPVLLSALGLVITGVLLVKGVRVAMLWGVLLTAAIGVPFGVVKYQGLVLMPPSMLPTFMKMDVVGALKVGLFTVIVVSFYGHV